MDELLTVVVVTYNQQHLVIETIQSILNQSYEDIELIIADDGSSDFKTDDIQNYIDKHKKDNIKKVTVYSNHSNMGTVKNLNKAIMISQGEYIKLIGGDDIFYNDLTFVNQVNQIKKSNTDVVFGCPEDLDTYLRGSFSNFNIRGCLKQQLLKTKKSKLSYFIRTDMQPFVTQSAIFRKSFFTKNGLFDEQYMIIEDLPLTYKILKYKIPYDHINSPTVLHRSSVGISSNVEFFSKKRKVYYNDLIKYYKNLCLTSTNIIDKIYCFEKSRLNKFRLNMSIIEKRIKLFYIIKYLDAIIFYVISQPTKFFTKYYKFTKVKR